MPTKGRRPHEKREEGKRKAKDRQQERNYLASLGLKLGQDGRPSEFLNQRRRFLIVCEGKKSEPCYLENLARRWRISANVVLIGAAGDPFNVVKKAEEQGSTEDYDETWALFDRDDFDLARLRNAFQYASTHNIRIAFSNESFELWLLLHLRRQEAAIGRKELIGKLKKQLGEYDKGDPTILDQLYRALPDAYQRANILAKRAQISQHGFEDNPYTGMYKLISALGESVPKVPSLEAEVCFLFPKKVE